MGSEGDTPTGLLSPRAVGFHIKRAGGWMGNRGEEKKPRTRTHKASPFPPQEAVKLEKMGYCYCYCHCYGVRRAGTRRRRGDDEDRMNGDECPDESSGPCETKPLDRVQTIPARRFSFPPRFYHQILVSFAGTRGGDRRFYFHFERHCLPLLLKI